MRTFLKRPLHVLLVLVMVFTSLMSHTGAAQTPPDRAIAPPDFDVQILKAEQDKLDEDTTLTSEQIALAKEAYSVAQKALEDAAVGLENINTLQNTLDNSPILVEQYREEIAKIDSGTNTSAPSQLEDMTGETLLRLQQQLISEEGLLRNYRAEIENLDETLRARTQRPLREELVEARSRLASVTTSLETLTDTDLDVQSQARKYSLEARQYYRRVQIRLLELEISSLSTRQQLTSLRREVAVAKAQQAEVTVISLQNLTGLRRLSEAQEKRQRALDMMMMVEKSHPYISHYAATNVSISNRLQVIATEAGTMTKKQAEARTRRDNVQSDLDIARQLTELGSLNRQSSATLRRLKNQRPSLASVKAEITQTRDSIVKATQARLWAQEELRQFSTGQFDAYVSMSLWREENPGARDLLPSERDMLNALQSFRRGLLVEIPDAAFTQISESDQLQIILTELLSSSRDLRDLLDQKMLWLPSTAAVDGAWPGRVIRGFASVADPEHFLRASQVLRIQFERYFFLALFFAALIGAAFLARAGLRQDISDRAKFVGRVQKDSYLHTPLVILECMVIAAPIPLFLLLFGVLFTTSGNGDPFIDALGLMGRDLAGFTWFFLSWREWSRDGSLLDKHYKLPEPIRRSFIRHLAWFIPFTGTTIALVTLTQNSREADVYEGFSLLAFIITALSLSYFGFKILWGRRTVFEKTLSDTHVLWRYRRVITVMVVGLPIMAAGLSAMGYYDTARELLSRLFFSGGLVIGTYIIYGLIRRTVVVAQRRLALRQAIERREKALKVRQEKEEAEERGETPPPTVDYEGIDLETLSRQSAQLLLTLVVIGFAVLMWFFWSDLVPALSIFDDVELWSHMVTDPEGIQKQEWITLWNLIQGMTIGVLTVIAARNLPGFLEVFFLNRSKLDAGARYAIVSIVGYIIIAVGFVLTFDRLGTEWSQFQWIIAALGVGIGFGLQEIIANFISGLIILFERPVRLGDYVTIGDQSGTITRIQIRATTLADLDSREILIPNKELITGRVTNWTLSNSTTRLMVRVGVAYGTDTDKAREIIFTVVRGNSKILDHPAPQVFFLGFGDSSLDFEIRVFLPKFEDRFPVSHALHTEINKALDDAGITIPFPQRDLHVMTAPGLPPVQVSQPPQVPVPAKSESKNPAAKKTVPKTTASKNRSSKTAAAKKPKGQSKSAT